MIDSTDWMKHGACRSMDPDFFFPHDGTGIDAPKKVCAGCTVRATCYWYAIDHGIDQGIWGGASERERRSVIRAQRKENSA